MISGGDRAIDSSGFWGERELAPGVCGCWRLGPLTLWARRRHSEWCVFAERGGEDEFAREFIADRPPKEDAAWKRWAFTGEIDRVSVLPVTPDRSVVARPESALRIPPDNEVLFFVSIPLWVRVTVAGTVPVILTEEATRVLSNTWFGEPTEGELGYALKTGASRGLEGVKPGSYRFLCPLLVKNHSAEELAFDKVCLPVPYLQLYLGGRRLWSNRIALSYLGRSQFSSVAFDEEPPGFEEGLEKIGEPRLHERKGFLRRSFATLRSFAV